MSTLSLAYYCSGHGYGHATRVSAFATNLRALPNPPNIYIVSPAPKHVFANILKPGVNYRHADIDPVVVQPVAYHVDRRKSVEVLKEFLSREDEKVAEEVSWLQDNKIVCVLSDAAYLPCKAANAAKIPSVLITNFTFDAIYSYLSVVLPDSSFAKDYPFWDDTPIPCEELQPLVTKMQDGYRCAHLLLRLPGNIPIPAFTKSPCLPTHLWTDGTAFLPAIEDALLSDITTQELLPPIAFDEKSRERKIMECPLILRHPSADIYSTSGRKRLLGSIGVPSELQTTDTKILIVSFGGQIFRAPSSRTSSRRDSSTKNSPYRSPRSGFKSEPEPHSLKIDEAVRRLRLESLMQSNKPIATETQILIPGAPPANKPSSHLTHPEHHNEHHAPQALSDPICMVTPPTPAARGSSDLSCRSYSGSTACSDETDSETVFDSDFEDEPRLLPDSSWIAIVCGASGDAKRSSGNGEDELPENFFIAPKDVYMPDLSAVGDVLLGKLGYGTVAECVDSCTPFIYVSRPLFIEEHGLRMFLQKSGVGVQLEREQYEAGDWAEAVEEAWNRGKAEKMRKRETGDDGKYQKEGMRVAAELLDWIRDNTRETD